MWTVTVARHKMVGPDPLVNRPALAAWSDRMKSRPSFVRAGIWEKAKPRQMLPVVWAKFRVPVLAILTVAALSTWGVGDGVARLFQ